MNNTVAIDSDAVAADVKLSAVGVLIFRNDEREPVAAGTGTFCRLGTVYGILTAGHVIENLPRSGQIGLVRFPSIQPYIQNLKIDIEHTDRVVIWNGVEGSAPDIAFLRITPPCVSSILSFGGVFYDLGKKRDFSPSQGRTAATCYAVVGVVAEWLSDLPGKRPNTRLKDVHGIFGAATIAKRYKEGSAQVLDCKINYAPDVKVPASYEGVSGGALWQLLVELDGTSVISMKKKLHGVAFRQSELIDNNRIVVCQGLDQVEALAKKMVTKWSGQTGTENS